jgi:signal peptidase II
VKRASPNYTHLIVWPAISIVVLDQLSKLAVAARIRLHASVNVIPGLFDLVHVRNRGMAFGFMNRPGMDLGYYFLVAASICALFLLLGWSLKLRGREPRLTFGLSMIMGGAAGNLIDRLLYREVIDFLDFYVGTLHWPAFNVADSAITVGTVWVAACLFLAGPRKETH